MVRLHRSSAIRWATVAHPSRDHHTARRNRRQYFLSSRAVPRPIPAQPIHRRTGWLVLRDDAHVRFRFRECDSGRTRSEATTMGSEESGQRSYRRHGGACLRRTMFSTRNARPQPAAPPPRSLPAWSDVHARCPLIAGLHVECRRRPRATGTSPHPDKPGWWRGSGRRTLGLVLNTAPRWQAPWWPLGPGRRPRRRR